MERRDPPRRPLPQSLFWAPTAHDKASLTCDVKPSAARDCQDLAAGSAEVPLNKLARRALDDLSQSPYISLPLKQGKRTRRIITQRPRASTSLRPARLGVARADAASGQVTHVRADSCGGNLLGAAPGGAPTYPDFGLLRHNSPAKHLAEKLMERSTLPHVKMQWAR